MVPIPTNPVGLMVNIVPPLPTFNPFPIVSIPTELLKTNFGDVAKSSNSLNNTSPLFPGGDIVILTFGGYGGPAYGAVTSIEFPIKTNCVVLLSPPTNPFGAGPAVFSLKTLMAPGIRPP